MVKLKEKPFLTPNEKGITGANDAASIQKAIDAATENGINKVVIPRYNKRTDSTLWSIGSTIRIPADMMLVLDNCRLELEEGFAGVMFTNSRSDCEEGKLIAGEQNNIRIVGQGEAVLAGAGEMIYLHNGRNFTVEGLRVEGSTGNAIVLMYCAYGKVSNIDFAGDHSAADQNGIVIRCACHDVTVENITGIVAGNMVSVLVEAGEALEVPAHVMGVVVDTRNIIIKNIKATCSGSLVKLHNQDGRMLYNILVEAIEDTSADYAENRPFSAVMIGGAEAKPNVRAALPGETKTITVRNVFTRAPYGVTVSGALTNTLFESIHLHGDGACALASVGEEAVKLHNILVKGVFCSERRDASEAVVVLAPCQGEHICLQDVFVDKTACVLKAAGEVTVAMDRIVVDELSGALVQADENAKVTVKNAKVKGEEQK